MIEQEKIRKKIEQEKIKGPEPYIRSERTRVTAARKDTASIWNL